MTRKVYIDGKLLPKDDAKISVFDHGLLYGDGVFEGIRVYGGKAFKLTEHLERLYAGARAICIEIPLDRAAMARAVEETIAANDAACNYIRLVVTRGVGDLGLDPRKCRGASVIIIVDEIVLYPKELYEKGMAIVTASTTRPSASGIPPQVKSLNYLGSVMAKIEGIQAAVSEVLLLNPQGYVAECSGDNIFIVKGNALLTPPPEAGILVGITRNTVMELAAKEMMVVRETNLTRFDLFTADECFLTGTAAEIIAVTRIDGRPVGTGTPGPVTKKLGDRYRALTAGK